MTETTTGECVGCGAPAEREMIAGQLAEIFNSLPLFCPRCDSERADRWEAEDRAEAERRGDDERRRRITSSGLPSALRAVDLENLDSDGAETAITAARRWAARGGGLLFTGPFGVGKTTIAAGALVLALARKPGRWTSVPLLMARLSSGLGSEQRAQALDLLTGTARLVLDDLDKCRPTEYGAEQIFTAVDGAVSNDRPLIVTTNLTLGALAAKWPAPYGEAIASRLAGYCEVVELAGQDRRLRGAA